MTQPIHYSISIPDVHGHLVEVNVEVPNVQGDTCRMVMPSWSPGSYLLREYGRHVQQFSATDKDGNPLPWQKTARGTWDIDLSKTETSEVHVSYRTFGHELPIRFNHIDHEHAFLHGPALFMYPEGRKEEPCALDVVAPEENWRIFTGLPCKDGIATPIHQGSFQASNFDQLADCPLELGDHREITFEADGTTHRLVFVGFNRAPIEKLANDIPRLVQATRELFGDIPYKRYLTIINHSSAGLIGGLEHKNSTALVFPRNRYATTEGYETFLCLFSHEHFHAWNVKRIRPEILGPFDYANEAYTRALWIMEGTTCYYEIVLMLRAGLMSRERFLELLGEHIGQIENTPGRKVRSLEEASFDAWIKHYRPDESSINTTISYYLKGEIISCLLDLEILAGTHGTKSLDDVMRYYWERYKEDKSKGFSEENFQSTVEDITGLDLSDFFKNFISGTTTPNYAAAFAHFGLLFEPKNHKPNHPHLGIQQKLQGKTLIAQNVKTGSPAHIAGVHAGDELVALGHQKLDQDSLDDIIASFAPGMETTLHVFRNGMLLELKVRFGSMPIEKYSLLPDPNASEEAVNLRELWLRS